MSKNWPILLGRVPPYRVLRKPVWLCDHNDCKSHPVKVHLKEDCRGVAKLNDGEAKGARALPP